MKQVFFKTPANFTKQVNITQAKLTTTITASGECVAAVSYPFVYVLSECDYNEAPNFERGE